MTAHCGRHTLATLLLANNADIVTISKILGHTTTQMTLLYA
ncbi:MAG: tyrosine-type recombinase/integrase, partial [Bacteroidales bacterium]|nr:tyrosine-type recombinase/integrase [Bacteroidales bacterium]